MVIRVILMILFPALILGVIFNGLHDYIQSAHYDELETIVR